MNANENRLYAIAEGQQGYFTAKQAVSCGYITQNHRHHIRSGAWIRECRGVYRLARFPASGEGQYVLWALWSRSRADVPLGVFSHQTALSIHELSDVMPARIHMIVPPGFRRNAALPKVLCLHRADLAANDSEPRQGYRVVRALRAIVDLAREGSESRDHLRQALQQATARGLITRPEIRAHPDRPLVESLLEGARQ